MTYKIQTREIDNSPANVAAMLKGGFFHTHQDGRWRYSAWGRGETVYVNDPTAHFERWPEGVESRDAAADSKHRLYVMAHRDGTRSVNAWDARLEPIGWQMYAPTDDIQRRQRVWIAAQMA